MDRRQERPPAGRSVGGEVAAHETGGHIEAFSAMTGDMNPLHYDKAAAERSVFGKLIVQGGVTTGILNALVAEDLPGPGTVFLEVNWQFKKAVGVGEEITGRVEVTKVVAAAS
jgi:acyl dehydratase